MENDPALLTIVKKITRVVCFLYAFILFPGINYSDTNNNLVKWAVIIRDKNTKEEISTIMNEIELTASQKFKFIFQPGEDVFTYLYHYSNEEKLSLIYPYKFRDLNPDYINEWYYVPSDPGDWYELDQKEPGTETFYFIASKNRLKTLESLTTQYKQSGGEKNTQHAVLEKILFLIKSNYPEEIIEDPVTITGIIKSDSIIAYEIRGIQFYSKVILIKPLGSDLSN